MIRPNIGFYEITANRSPDGAGYGLAGDYTNTEVNLFLLSSISLELSPVIKPAGGIMPKTVWKGAVIAESEATQVVEGNHYFPPESVSRDHLSESDHHTVCGWKGTASYFDVVVDGETNQQAAWYYPEPKESAANIKDHVAFWKGVEVQS